jgi:hypothetical protein
MGRSSLEATNARLMRIARGDGRLLRRVALARADRTPDRSAPFLVVTVFFDPVFEDAFLTAFAPEVAGFLGVDESGL